MSTTAARAIVALEPGADHQPGSNWHLQNVSVRSELQDGELLVEMVASGICHSDLVATSAPAGVMVYPRIAGHEGSGFVKAIGPNVHKHISVGDAVLLSFDYCTSCESCRSGHPAYCETFTPLNIIGSQGVFTTKDGKDGMGKFFGQSSFASLSVVNEASVLPAGHLAKTKEDLKLFAPLGCGIQTGAGAVLNIVKPTKQDRVMVLGLGGVGLAAIMAAAICGCQQIVAVDIVESRIELAKTLGATHGANTSGVSDIVAAFKDVCNGIGPTVVVDTTGATVVYDAGYRALTSRGKYVMIGVPANPQKEFSMDIRMHMMSGKQVLGCCEGDSVPSEFIPRLIEYYRDGKLPLDKISKFYKAEDYKAALHDMHTGEAIKPILLW